jgi:primase-polymerase (primpol)-like protein
MDNTRWSRIPATLRLRPQWLAWRWAERPDKDTGELKLTKVPYQARYPAYEARSNTPRTWAPFGTALRACRADATLGLGFVFAPGGGLVGVDLDGCRDAATGALSPFAWEVVTALDSYTEVTPSGTGLHILVAGTLPGARRQRKAPGANVELYPDGRFFTMTGDWLPVTPTTVEERTAALGALYGTLFPPEPPPPPQSVVATPETLTDTAILRIASGARNGAKFRALMRGETTGYASASEADAALRALLAFYTSDPAQLERLFSLSALADAKWRGRADYRARTLGLALRRRTARFGAREVAA